MKLTQELPQMISFQIIQWCDLHTRMSFYATCKSHYQESSSPMLWRDLDICLPERPTSNASFNAMMEVVHKRGPKIENLRYTINNIKTINNMRYYYLYIT